MNIKKYGSIKNGIFVMAPNPIISGGTVHFNPSDDIYEQYGYLPIQKEPYPYEVRNKYFIAAYEEKEGYIRQYWVETDIPPQTQEDLLRAYKELIIKKIRMIYSIDDELAIIRQKDSKPEEFEVYYNFVEQCKIEAKNELGI